MQLNLGDFVPNVIAGGGGRRRESLRSESRRRPFIIVVLGLCSDVLVCRVTSSDFLIIYSNPSHELQSRVDVMMWRYAWSNSLIIIF